MKKWLKQIVKWAPVIYPVVRKIYKERKASKSLVSSETIDNGGDFMKKWLICFQLVFLFTLTANSL